MSEANAKRPAFPIETKSFDQYGGIIYDQSYGTTKREYFAAMAMQGLMNNIKRYDEANTISLLCADAVVFADELLKQLEK